MSRLLPAAVLWCALGASVLSFAQTPPAPIPPRPGLVLVGDMWLPEEVVFGDGNFEATPWTNGNVRILFDSAISSSRREKFREVMRDLEAVAHLSFIELSSPAGNYIRVLPSTDSGVSSSEIGMVGGEQELRVWSTHWDLKFVLMHELMHALGYLHEQSRPDRDAYVQILWPFIEPGREHNFTLRSGAVPLGGYDFTSIMHYRATAFGTIPGINTILCRPGFEAFQDQLGNRSYLSQGDCNALQALYGQPAAPDIATISPTSVFAGSGAVNLTVTGSWFYRGPIVSLSELGTEVTINGTPVPTTYVDNHTLTCTIPAGSLTSPGALSIRVRNHPEAGGTSTASRTFTILCPSVSADRGKAVAGLGDVNGDGFDDYAVGSPGEFTQTGRVAVHSGRDTSIIWQATGTGTNTGFGYALAAIGDVNGDGRQDLLIGSPYTNSQRGRFEIRSGANGTQLALVNGNTAGSYFGNAVAAAGDVDQDGDLDFLIGSPGQNTSTGRVELWSFNGGLMRSHAGESTFDGFGIAISGGVDLTGDGAPDYAVGAPFQEGGGALRGKIYVYSGASGVLVTSKTGDGDFDQLGTSVVVVPRIGAPSGTGDIVAGAPEPGANGTGASMGRGYVRWYRGGGNLINPLANWAVLGTFQGTTVGDCYGQALAYAGDADDDGRSEILVGAMQDAEGPALPVGDGYAELLAPATGTRLQRYNGPSPLNPNIGGQRGAAVAWIGDRDADGQLDYVVGAPETDVPCLGTGSVDVFSAKVPPAIRRVLITEVSAGEPDAVELTNYGTTAVNLSGYTLKWRDGGNLWTSAALNITLQPGEIAVVTEPGAPPAETPAGIQVIARLPAISSNISDYAVGLISPNGHTLDEVRVAGTNGQFNDAGVGGKFRGYAAYDLAPVGGVIYFSVHVERSLGLDSNSGADWFSSSTRSLGLENLCAGTRGTDPIPTSRIRINEIDTDPDYVEIRGGQTTEDVTNWYFLASSLQGNLQSVVRFDWSRAVSFNSFPPGYFLVLGDQATAPAEMPITAGYFNVGSPGFPWITKEFDLTLYDHYGRVVDHVRATEENTPVVHNHPRAPTAVLDFRGAAKVTTSVDSSIGRNSSSTDTNSGLDWRTYRNRSMGAPNTSGGNWQPNGATDPGGYGIDLRLNATAAGGGITFLLNAGEEYAGHIWSFSFSVGHLDGSGPIFGLGPEAVNNWLLLSTTPPFAGILDERGAARFDVPAGTIPPGLDTDNVIAIQTPSGALVVISPVYEYDS